MVRTQKDMKRSNEEALVNALELITKAAIVAALVWATGWAVVNGTDEQIPNAWSKKGEANHSPITGTGIPTTNQSGCEIDIKAPHT
jgi:hypothetical protein